MTVADTFLTELNVVIRPDQRLAGTIASGAIFGEHERHRYALWRIWEPGLRPLVTIGLNPSTATEAADDPTIRRCINFARDWGHGGLVMLNLFSYRSTDPSALEHKNRLKVWNKIPDKALVDGWVSPNWPELVTGGPANDAYLRFFTRSHRAGAILAAWGNHGWIAGRDRIVENMLQREGVQLLALGVTKHARPAHPLYQPKAAVPVPYSSGLLL